MGRLLAIDYGQRRCGIAVTDPMRIVANGLTTVDSSKLVEFLQGYIARETVDMIVVGKPTTMRGEDSDSNRYIGPAIGRLKKAIPDIPVVFYDERFTSVLAHRAMIDGGLKKSDRRNKGLVDEISATIILNDYLQSGMYGNSPH